MKLIFRLLYMSVEHLMFSDSLCYSLVLAGSTQTLNQTYFMFMYAHILARMKKRSRSNIKVRLLVLRRHRKSTLNMCVRYKWVTVTSPAYMLNHTMGAKLKQYLAIVILTALMIQLYIKLQLT